jgi:4-amino-4-deoxy-L-arabinose transferase-like glycosyltransferase
VIIYSNGLKKFVPAYHGIDEVWHLMAIKRFTEQFPFFNFTDYESATPPLFHILMVTAGKIFGFELFKLRLLNVFISYFAVFLLYYFLIKISKIQSITALLIALVFELSPYYFGSSFHLFTDNLAVLLLIAFLFFFSGTRKMKTFKLLF